MKVAFPVKDNNGLESIIDDHFGVAKKFMIVDVNTRQYELIDNQKLLPDASKCKTGVLGKEHPVDAVITKCMGDGARKSLSASNIKVLQAQKDTIMENLELLSKDELKLFHMFDHCQDKKNKKEGGCGHHH